MTRAATRAAGDTGLRSLPLLLSIVAGLTDVSTFVLLDGLFSAHITGNLVVLAADIATDRPVNRTSVLAIPFFIATAAVVTALATRSSRPPGWWITVLAATQSLFIAAAGVLSIGLQASTHPGGIPALGTGLLAIAAMAVQNSLLHVVFRKSPSTAVMTGNVVEATVSGVRVLVGRPGTTDEDRAAWCRTWPLIAGFLVGCLFGGLACGILHDVGWILPIAAALVVALHCRRVQPTSAATTGPAASA